MALFARGYINAGGKLIVPGMAVDPAIIADLDITEMIREGKLGRSEGRLR